MTKWIDEPWADHQILQSLLSDFYIRAFKETGKDPVSVTVAKVRQTREWCSRVTDEDIRRAVEELEMVYIPAAVGPGPGLAVPLRDTTEEIRRLHIRLIGPSFQERYGLGWKYLSLVDTDRFTGPSWIGTSDDTLTSIIQTQEVLLVEGPLDLLAVRTIPNIMPSLSTTTKKLTDDHWDYLRILGVQHVYVMFDNEVSEVGTTAAHWVERNPYKIDVTVLTCPAKDPAAALMNPQTAMRLRQILQDAG